MEPLVRLEKGRLAAPLSHCDSEEIASLQIRSNAKKHLFTQAASTLLDLEFCLILSHFPRLPVRQTWISSVLVRFIKFFLSYNHSPLKRLQLVSEPSAN